MKVKTGVKAGMALGDAVAGFSHATRLDKLAEAYTRVTGRDCVCERRRKWLNTIST